MAAKKKENLVEKRKTKGIENKDNKNVQEISKINRFNILFADLQVVFTILTIVCIVWYFFNTKVWHVLQFVLGITLIVIGYNNKIIYNRPKFAYVYYVIGILLIIFEILLLLGV